MRMKSKFSRKTLEKIANAWYYGKENGIGIGDYQYKIAFDWDKKEWGIFRAKRNELVPWDYDALIKRKSPWEWVEAIDKKQFQCICEQEILET